MSAGVYKIEHVPTGRVYIGSSSRMEQRLSAHRSHFKNGTHANKHLLLAWRKYGSEQFTLTPLLECSKNMLLFYEQRAIEAYKANDDNHGFNKRLYAHSNRGVPTSEKQKDAVSAMHVDPVKNKKRLDALNIWRGENKALLMASMQERKRDPAFEAKRKAAASAANSARCKGVVPPAEHMAKLQAGRAAYVARGRFHQASFTDEDVIAIRQDSRSHRAIARERGVDKSTVSDVRNRRTYRHIP